MNLISVSVREFKSDILYVYIDNILVQQSPNVFSIWKMFEVVHPHHHH